MIQLDPNLQKKPILNITTFLRVGTVPGTAVHDHPGGALQTGIERDDCSVRRGGWILRPALLHKKCCTLRQCAQPHLSGTVPFCGIRNTLGGSDFAKL